MAIPYCYLSVHCYLSVQISLKMCCSTSQGNVRLTGKVYEFHFGRIVGTLLPVLCICWNIRSPADIFCRWLLWFFVFIVAWRLNCHVYSAQSGLQCRRPFCISVGCSEYEVIMWPALLCFSTEELMEIVRSLVIMNWSVLLLHDVALMTV